MIASDWCTSSIEYKQPMKAYLAKSLVLKQRRGLSLTRRGYSEFTRGMYATNLIYHPLGRRGTMILLLGVKFLVTLFFF